MVDRVLLGRNLNDPIKYSFIDGEWVADTPAGLYVSRPTANVTGLVGNTYIEGLKDWYGYQEEFDQGVGDGAWSLPTQTTAYQYLYTDPEYESITTSGNIRFSFYGASRVNQTQLNAGGNHGQIKRTANNTLLLSPTGKFLLRTPYMDSSTFGAGVDVARCPDDRAFRGDIHNVIEMRIRMNPNHPDPPPVSSADMRIMFNSSPVNYNNPDINTGLGTHTSSWPAHSNPSYASAAGPPGGSPPGAAFHEFTPANEAEFYLEDPSPHRPDYFWAHGNRSATYYTLHNDQSTPINSAVGYTHRVAFEYPYWYNSDRYNINGLSHIEAGTTRPNGAAASDIRLGNHSTLLGGDGTPGSTDGEWHTVEWDMSTMQVWQDPYGHAQEWADYAEIYNQLQEGRDAVTPGSGNQRYPYNLPHLNDGKRPYTSDYRIFSVRLDPIYNVNGTDWAPKWTDFGEDPNNPPWLFEIDYIRIKKKGVPQNAGKYGSVADSMLFRSDWQGAGLVHQTGVVEIGNAKAFIDGTPARQSASTVWGPNWETTASEGRVDLIEPLPYIPVVIFQRFDPAADPPVSFPAGENEFSVGITRQDSQRYPRTKPKTDSDGIASNTAPEWSSSSGDGLINTLDYEHTDWNGVFRDTGASHTHGDHDAAPYNHSSYTETDWSSFTDINALPWNTTIPAPSNRQGENFLPAKNFSEIRTFAYSRAAKDHFQITCRNAIAQEGLEPVLNLAPVFPEDGVALQGSDAYANMNFRTNNGNWGMFHPGALWFEDWHTSEHGNPGAGGNQHNFEEGKQLGWDTLAHANTAWLDKKVRNFTRLNGVNEEVWDAFSNWAPAGQPTDTPRYTSLDINGNFGDNRHFTFNSIYGNHKNGEIEEWDNYEQFQWRPLLSVSPVIFNGDLARPPGALPTDGADYPKDLTGIMNMGEEWTAERAASPALDSDIYNSIGEVIYAPETGHTYFGNNHWDHFSGDYNTGLAAQGGVEGPPLRKEFDPPALGGALQYIFPPTVGSHIGDNDWRRHENSTGINTSIDGQLVGGVGASMIMATADFYKESAQGINPEELPGLTGLTETGNTFVNDRHGANAWSGDTGGFYPYRYMKQLHSARMSNPNPHSTNPVYEEHVGTDGITHNVHGTNASSGLGLKNWTWKYTYGYEKWSCDGIYHPPGTVPESSHHFDNRHADVPNSGSATANIYNQTSYIGGSFNEKDNTNVVGARARAVGIPSKVVRPIYRYYVLKIPATYNS